MLEGKRSSLLTLLLLLAVTAAGQNFPVSTTVLNTTSAEITNFSVVTGSVVDFLFTIHDVGNTNISVFPEMTVNDSNNNTVVQLIYDTYVNISAGSLKDLTLSWITGSSGNFTAKLIVFYDNNTKSITASKNFVLLPAYAPTSSGGDSWTAMPTPVPISTVKSTPIPAPTESPVLSTPQQFQPIVAVAAVTASTGILAGILTGILGFALAGSEATINQIWIISLGVLVIFLFILRRKMHA